MVRVRKRNRRFERFAKSKITAGVKKAGATTEQAAHVAKEVGTKVGRRAVVKAEELSVLVVRSLGKVNKAAAHEFVRYRNKKLRAKKRRHKKIK